MSALKQMPSITELQQHIRELSQQIAPLKLLSNKGTITVAGAAYLAEMESQKFNAMEELVLSVHHNAIQTGKINKNGIVKTYYQTRLKGVKTPPRCYSYNRLVEKLYNFYFSSDQLNDYSFRSVFNTALDEKIRTESPKEKTLRDYSSSYKAFITPEFGERDIRDITPAELKEYIQTITKNLCLTKKRFYKFKGILNMAFKYAAAPEHGIIIRNIVPAGTTYFKHSIKQVPCKPEDKAFQPNDITKIREHLWNRISKQQYDVNGYAILFSTHTGVRQAEIPSLKWSDIYEDEGLIHIHAQQNDEMRNGVRCYYYNPCTKNEKGESRDGRYIPLTDEISYILTELKHKQDSLGITSEWVFSRENGEWITTDSYYKSLRRLCKRLNLELSNNHAFRIAYNSYVLIPLGIDAPERARILGHSVETNLKHYTFSRDKEYLKEIKSKLDNFNSFNRNTKG